MAAGEQGGPAINIYGPNESLALTLTLFTEQEASGGHGAAQPLLWVLAREPGLGWALRGTPRGLHGVTPVFDDVTAGHKVPEEPGEPDAFLQHGVAAALG